MPEFGLGEPMRILFTTMPLSGHFFPLVPLAWAARANGHEVLVLTPDNFRPTVLRTGLPAVAAGPAMDFAALAGDADHDSEWRRRYEHGEVFGRITASALDRATEVVETWRPDLIISERAEFAGPIAGAAAGVPRAELRWGVAELGEYRAGAAEVLAADLLTRGLDTLPEPEVVLDPWPASLRLPHARDHRGLRHVSFNGDAGVPVWALRPRTRPRVCVTLGTLVPHLGLRRLADQVVPLLERLSELDIELVLAVDEQVLAGWPPLPEAVRHAGRLPLVQVLRACDALIHHGGQGTALTAFDARCPQLVLPQFDDQFENADAVVRSGAGVRLLPAEITADNVAKGCLEVVHAVRFRLAAARIADEMAAQPSPAATLDDLAELAA